MKNGSEVQMLQENMHNEPDMLMVRILHESFVDGECEERTSK